MAHTLRRRCAPIRAAASLLTQGAAPLQPLVPSSDNLAEFNAWCQRHITREEKGQAQIFSSRCPLVPDSAASAYVRTHTHGKKLPLAETERCIKPRAEGHERGGEIEQSKSN